MSSLTVRLDCGAAGHQLVVEVVDVAARSTVSGAVSDGGQAAFPATPGRHYLVTAVRPDGAVFSDEALVEGDGAEVHLGPAGVPAESATAGDTAAVGGEPEAPSFGPGAADSVEAAPVSEAAAPGAAPAETTVVRTGLPPAWGCVWVLDGSWRPRPWAGADPQIVEGGVDVDLDELPPHQLHAFQVGGADVASTVVLLPPSWHLTVSLRRTATGEDLAVSARTGDEAVESLLAYLTSSQLVAAGTVARPVLDDAESMLFGKLENPVGAVVGALFLLRTRALDRLHHWPRNLADWFPWLPDASAVRAGQLLAQPEVPRSELRRRLITAAAAGVPIYTDSLSWLYEGLRLLAAETNGDAEVQTALKRVWPYADACDWSVALTTFRARSPAEPTFERITSAEGPAGFARAVVPDG